MSPEGERSDSITPLGDSMTAVHKVSLVSLTNEDVLRLLIIALLLFIPVPAMQIPIAEILSMLLKAPV
jgi:hypothetical protein